MAGRSLGIPYAPILWAVGCSPPLQSGTAYSGVLTADASQCSVGGEDVPCETSSDPVTVTLGSIHLELDFVLEPGGGLSVVSTEGYWWWFTDVCATVGATGQRVEVSGRLDGLAPGSAWTSHSIALIPTIEGGEIADEVTACGTPDEGLGSRTTRPLTFDVDLGFGDLEDDGALSFSSSPFEAANGADLAGTFRPI